MSVVIPGATTTAPGMRWVVGSVRGVTERQWYGGCEIVRANHWDTECKCIHLWTPSLQLRE